MSRVRHGDLRRFSEAVARLYAPATLEEFPQRVHAAFAHLFPNLCISYDEVDYATGVTRNAVDQTLSLSRADFLDRWENVALDHPSIRYLAGGGKRPVLQLSDFVSERQFRETSLYREFWYLLGIRHQMNALFLTPERLVGVAVNRDLAFSAEEYALLELLQPHFAQAYQTARLLSGLGPVPTLDYGPWRAHGFTRRECEVLRWLMEGKRNSEIAVILGISPLTVKKHVEHIHARLHVETRAAAAARAREILIGSAVGRGRAGRMTNDE